MRHNLLVIIWALAGIAVKQNSSQTTGIVVEIAIAVIVFGLAIGLVV